jgi:hypothetical protein
LEKAIGFETDSDMRDRVFGKSPYFNFKREIFKLKMESIFHLSDIFSLEGGRFQAILSG